MGDYIMHPHGMRNGYQTFRNPGEDPMPLIPKHRRRDAMRRTKREALQRACEYLKRAKLDKLSGSQIAYASNLQRAACEWGIIRDVNRFLSGKNLTRIQASRR